MPDENTSPVTTETQSHPTVKFYDSVANELFKLSEALSHSNINQTNLTLYIENLAELLVAANNDLIAGDISVAKLNRLLSLRYLFPTTTTDTVEQYTEAQLTNLKNKAYEEGYNACLKSNKKASTKRLTSILVDEKK